MYPRTWPRAYEKNIRSNFMQLLLTQYKQDELVPVKCDYDPKVLDLEFVDLKYLDQVHLKGTVEKGVDTLSFRGRLESDVEHLCGRCLKTVKAHVSKPFQLYYEIKDKVTVETTDDLREILIIDHPITYVCSENCKGLCPRCGINLNESSCSCKSLPEPSQKKSLSGLKEAWEKKYGGQK